MSVPLTQEEISRELFKKMKIGEQGVLEDKLPPNTRIELTLKTARKYAEKGQKYFVKDPVLRILYFS